LQNLPGLWRIAAECLLASIGLGVLTFAAFRVHATTATAALLFFFFVVLISLWARFATSVCGCILAVLSFNYFFAPPIFDLRVHDPWDIALAIAFSITGLVISRLVSNVRKRTAELTQSNQKLRRSEESLLEAQRLSRTGSWQRDVVSGIVTVSPEIHQIWGSSPDEDSSTAEFWINRIHPEDRKAAWELFEKTTIQKAAYRADYRIVLPDGTIKHLHVIGHPVLNESGDLVEFVGTSMDVTEAKQAEAKIRQSERELRQLLDLSPLHITEFGPDGSPLYNNKAALDYHGLTLEEWQSADLHSLLHPQDAERAASEGPGKFRSGSPYEMEVRLRRKDGQYRWFLFRFNPIRDEQGSLMPRRPISRIARRLSNDSRTRTLRCAKKSIRHRCSRRSLELLPFYRRYSLAYPKSLPRTQPFSSPAKRGQERNLWPALSIGGPSVPHAHLSV